MLPEFTNQFFQLPLIETTWTCARNRYIEERKTASFLVRFTFSMLEQTISIVHGNIIQPLLVSCQSYFNPLDRFLCSRIDSLHRLWPILDQTSEEIIERYGDLFVLSFFNKNSASTSKTSDVHQANNTYQESKFQFINKYFRFLTHILMVIEMYSKYIQNELNDRIDSSRNLWKNLNMEDGRSLDKVESFSEKVLVLGRRMTGNYRQFVYLIRYQFKRCRHILFSFLNIQSRFRSTVWRVTRKIQIDRMNEKLNDRAQYGLITSKERVRHYLEVMMLHAAKHPWMRWTSPRFNGSSQPQFSRALKIIRSTFFVSSNHTSDCSEAEDNLRDRTSKVFESTPYRKNHADATLLQAKEQMEDVLSNIFSSSSSGPEQTMDVNDIVRQIGSASPQMSDSISPNDREEENRVIEEALNASNDTEQHAVSALDLSPGLASGRAV